MHHSNSFRFQPGRDSPTKPAEEIPPAAPVVTESPTGPPVTESPTAPVVAEPSPEPVVRTPPPTPEKLDPANKVGETSPPAEPMDLSPSEPVASPKPTSSTATGPGPGTDPDPTDQASDASSVVQPRRKRKVRRQTIESSDDEDEAGMTDVSTAARWTRDGPQLPPFPLRTPRSLIDPTLHSFRSSTCSVMVWPSQRSSQWEPRNAKPSCWTFIKPRSPPRSPASQLVT